VVNIAFSSVSQSLWEATQIMSPTPSSTGEYAPFSPHDDSIEPVSAPRGSPDSDEGALAPRPAPRVFNTGAVYWISNAVDQALVDATAIMSPTPSAFSEHAAFSPHDDNFEPHKDPELESSYFLDLPTLYAESPAISYAPEGSPGAAGLTPLTPADDPPAGDAGDELAEPDTENVEEGPAAAGSGPPKLVRPSLMVSLHLSCSM
jgi:hypothetical protein